MNIYARNVVAIVLLLPIGLISQNQDNKNLELGNFFISHYKRDFLRSSFFNTVVLQDKEGVIYVGNSNKGLIEFDGQRVRRVLKDGKPMIDNIKGAEIDSNNTIYLGLNRGNFGYLEKNKFGQNEYISLSDQLSKKADFWGLEVHQDTVFFQTDDAVYLFKDKKYLRSYKFKDNLHNFSSSPDGVYLRIWGKGLFKYAAKDGFSVIKGSEKLFAQNQINANYQLDNGDHLLVSRNIGLIRMTKNGEFLPVNNTYANKYVIEGKSYLNDKVMRNGKIAIITSDKGVLFLNQDLSTNSEVGMSSGLPESGLNRVMQDRVGDIWGANSGATKISFDPSLTNFSSLNGIVGDVTDIIRHQGKLIVRTEKDLFQFVPKKSMTETSVFKSLDVKERGWSLSLFDDQIICSNFGGINAVLNGKKLKISDTGRNVNSIQSKLNPSLLFSSNLSYGLLLHQFNGKVWKQIKIIGGEKYSGNNIIETEPGKILISTRKGIVLFKYDLSGQGTFTPIDQDKSFAKTKNLEKLFYLNDKLLVSIDSTFKIFVVDTKAQKLRYSGFSLDKMVSGELWKYTYNKEAGYGWLVCKKGLFKTYFDIKKGFTFKKYPFYKVDLDELSYRVLPEGSGENEVIWFGSQESKLYRYLPALALKEPAQQFKALIRSISSNGEPVPIVPETLPFSQNNLVFEVAYPLFGTENKTTFSYWLEKQDDTWSEYIKDFKKEYTNLREGTYTFHVRAMDASGHVSDETSVKFKISPPWYRTILAYLVYLGLLGYLFILFGKYHAKKSRGKAEHERKNKELKAAQDLQNSMLPKVLPQNAGLDIAVFIRSSTEVGGDYYDFFEHKGKALYAICGDATGHGVASGMMVSVTKAGLNGIDALPVNTILHKLNNIVKNIDLGTLRMSLNVVQIKSNEFELSSAGMPPVYHYVAATNKVEEILTVGLPLGGLREEHFDILKRSFNKGDIIVQLSDGLPEAPNLVGEMYDYERLGQLIENNGSKSAQGMIDSLIASVDSWLQGQHNPDDITLVVIKKTND
jgi:hypothetical protein